MYLDGVYRVFGVNEEERENNEAIRKALKGVVPNIDVKSGNLNYIYITIEVGYWRKANAIHRWFVENVQNGKDDCGTYWVDREKLKELKALCEKVLKNPEEAPNILPTQSGFFFGSTEYDEWYFEDIKRTIEIIDRALSMDKGWEFYYESSW